MILCKIDAVSFLKLLIFKFEVKFQIYLVRDRKETFLPSQHLLRM